MDIIKLIFLVFFASLTIAEKCPVNKSSSKLFCYYSKLQNVENCKCTHVILPANSDVKSIDRLRKVLNGVKILVTVHEFNEGLVQLLKNTKVDGLEINLKKIDSRNDIADFISTAKSKLGSELVTVVSVPPRADLLAKFYDFKGLTKHTDAFILQTAFLGASRNVTFHPSRLSGLWDMQNADSVVDLVVGLGAPLSKLVISAPVQAFQFTLQHEDHTAVGSPALEIKSISRNELCEKMTNSNWTLERDQDQAGPYIFRKNEWIAFDDTTSMDIKAKYTRVRGLAGLALKDLSQDGGQKCGGNLLNAAYEGLSKQARAPRGAVLHSLEREILESPAKSYENIQLSPYRITRVIDVDGKVHAVRQDTRTEFACTRQGYFVHPRSCNRFYRCVKFNQLSEEYNVFEFDCPAGLAFDERVEVCVWPGSLPDGSACSGSSEIAPVPKERYVCPHEPGYYADPENCRWFFACLDHGESGLTPYEFRCPFGLVFDQDHLVCEWHWLVPKCANGAGSGYVLGVYQPSVQFYGSNGQAATANIYALENYDGLGALAPVKLGGIVGKIEQPINKVYSSFGNHASNGGNVLDGGNLHYNNGGIQNVEGIVHNSENGGSILGINANGYSDIQGGQGYASQESLKNANTQILLQNQGSGLYNQGSIIESQGLAQGSQASQYQNQGVSHSAQVLGNQGLLIGLQDGQYQSQSAQHGSEGSQFESLGSQFRSDGSQYQSLGSQHGSERTQFQSIAAQHGAKVGQYESQLVGGAARLSPSTYLQGSGQIENQASLLGTQYETVNLAPQNNKASYDSFQGSQYQSQAALHGSQDKNQLQQVSQHGYGQFESQAHGNVDNQDYITQNQNLIGKFNLIDSSSNQGLDIQKSGERGYIKYQKSEFGDYNEGNAYQGLINAQEINISHQREDQDQQHLVNIHSQNLGQSNKYTNTEDANANYQNYGTVSFGFATGGFGRGIQGHRHDVSNLNQGVAFANSGHQNIGSKAYSSQNINLVGKQSVDIIGGGFSAVKDYSNHGFQTIDSVTPSIPIAVTTAIPTVTSVPLPNNVDVYEGGVVANIPELQVKVHSPSEENIFRGNFNQSYITTTSVPISVSEGYVYEKPKVPFVEGQTAFSYSQQNIEHKNVQAQEGYHYRKPSIVFEEKPRTVIAPAVQLGIVEADKTNSAFVNHVFSKTDTQSEGYHYPKPSIRFEDGHKQILIENKPSAGYSYQHFNKEVKGTIQSVTPSILVEQKKKILEKQPVQQHFEFPQQHVQVHQSVVAVQPVAQDVEKTVVQPAHSYSYQSFGHSQNKEYVNVEQPIVEQSIVQQPVIEQTILKQPSHQTIAQQPLFLQNEKQGHSYSYQSQNSHVNLEQPLHQQTLVQQPVIQQPFELKNVEHKGHSYSYQSFGKSQVNIEQPALQQTILQEPVQTIVQQPVQTIVQQPVQTIVQQPIQTIVQQPVQTIVQQPVEEHKIHQPAHSYSYQSFGKNENKVTVEQPILKQIGVQQPIHSITVQQPVHVEKTVFQQPAHSYSYQSFGKFQNNLKVQPTLQTVAQQPIHEIVVQQPVHVEKSVVQRPINSHTYQSFENFQNNIQLQRTHENTIQQPIHVEKTILQPARPFSYQTSGNFQEYSKVDQPIIQQTISEQPQHIFEKIEQPIIQQNIFEKPEIQKTVVHEPAHSYSYQSFGDANSKKFSKVKQSVLQEAIVEQPLHQTIIQPVVQKAVLQQPGHSYSYQSFGSYGDAEKYSKVGQAVHKILQEPIHVEQYVKQPVDTGHYNYQQSFEASKIESITPSILVNQPVQIQKTVQQPILIQKEFVQQPANAGGHSYSYQSFGAKQQKEIFVQPQVEINKIVSSTLRPYTIEKEIQQPKIIFEKTVLESQPQEPVKEEPFVAKQAYVTGNSYYHQKSNRIGSYSISSTPNYVESYVSSTPKDEIYYQSTPQPDILIQKTQQPIFVQTTPKVYVETPRQTVFVQPTEATLYLTSTPRPTYQSVVSTTDTSAEPLKFYIYDSRLKSTLKPEVIPTVYDNSYSAVSSKQSRPISRFEFSSFDSKYNDFSSTVSTTPYIEMSSPKRVYFPARKIKLPTPSNAYLPVKVSTTTSPYLEVTTPLYEFKSTTAIPRTYLPAKEATIIENYQANNEFDVTKRPVKVIKVIRPKSKAIVKVNDFHPMLSAKLGGQCTCVSNTLTLKKNPINVIGFEENDDDDDGYVVDNSQDLNNLGEYEAQKVIDVTPSQQFTISSTLPTIPNIPVVIRKRVKVRPTISYEETPVTKAIEVFYQSTRKPSVKIIDDDEPSEQEVKQAVRTGLKLVKAAAKQGAKEGTEEVLADFDRYGPGGVRSRVETLQGIDCQRAGLFRHPTQCNKFYSCRWDCDKKKFTLHVFNCPVHLTFDNNLGACNWPSQGPACAGNTLLPSD